MDGVVLLQLVGGGLLLVVGAEALVRGAASLATTWGVTPLAVGLTVVAFGTSAPELAVSVQGALAGAGDVAVGNVVGSNVFNLLAILGMAAIAGTLVVHRRVVRLDLPILVIVTLAVGALAWGGRLSRVEGLVLAAGLLVYTGWVYTASRREQRASAAPDDPAAVTRPGWWMAGAIVLGLSGLVAGAQLFVSGATSFATAVGMSELAIGLTVVAAGTSLPELATSVAAAARGHRDIAVGNVVGSNLFNLLGVLGVSAAVAPDGLAVADTALRTDLPLSLLATLVVLPCLVTGLVVLRWEGALLLASYAGYLAVVLAIGTGDPRAGVLTRALVVLLAVAATTLTLVGWWSRRRRPPADDAPP